MEILHGDTGFGMYLNVLEYAGKCVYMPKSARISFFAFPHSTSLSI